MAYILRQVDVLITLYRTQLKNLSPRGLSSWDRAKVNHCLSDCGKPMYTESGCL
jgi:hypothetical protein